MENQESENLNILWLKADPLYPLNSGGRIRTYQMLFELNKRHNITYLAFFPINTDQEAKINSYKYSSSQVWIPWRDTKMFSLRFLFQILKNLIFSKYPYVIDKYTSNHFRKALKELLAKQDFDFVITDFMSTANNVIGLEKNQSKFVVFQHNVESQIWRRHYYNASNFFKKFYMYIQWQRMLKFEKSACSWFDGVIGVSGEDTDFFRNKLSLSNILGDVPTGVDIDYFQEMSYQPKNNSIVFLGSMDWMPNIDGICYFVKEIYPLIKQKYAEIKLTIVGRNPTDRILALAQDKSIKVTGTVDDVRKYLSSSSVSIVPLRIGGGTRIKIFESMAAGVPVVSTSIGAEGLPLRHGEHILMAEKPNAFASEVLKLLNNEQMRNKISANALKLIEENYSWKTVVNEFERLLGKII